MIDANRDTTAIICNGNGIIRIDIYMNLRTKSGQMFINCIVYNLIDQMVQTFG